MTTEDKLLKLRELADAMYYAAQYLTTDASRLHKAMDEYHQFIIHEYHKEEPTIPDIVDEHWWKMLGEEHVSNKMGGINNALSQDRLAMKSVDEAMAEVEAKAKAFTEAHKGESSEQLLAEMRGEEHVSEDLEKIVEEIAEPTILNAYGTKELARRLRNTICYISVSEELEEASKEWLRPQLDKSYANYGEAKMMELTHFDGYAMLDAIEFGAKWQKEKGQKK